MPDKQVPELDVLSEALPHMAAGVRKWREDNPPDSIRERVFNLLNKRQDEIILQLLGFELRYGKLQVDHCNGRAGESAAGDYLRRAQQDAVNDWLATISMPALTKTQIKNIQKDAQREYTRHLNQLVRSMAVTKAEEDAKKLIEALASTHSADNYGKLYELIQPPEEQEA